jgi:hypothetical protein
MNTNTIETMKLMLELTKAGYTKAEVLAACGIASNSQPVQIAHAEAIDTPPTEKVGQLTHVPAKQESFRVSAEDILAEAKTDRAKALEPSEFNFWKRVTTKGNTTTWCGWANPNNGEENYPGHKLFYINHFYITNLGVRRDGFSDGTRWISLPGYNIRKQGNMRIMADYEVRNVVEKKDKEAFEQFMAEMNEGRQKRNKVAITPTKDWFEQ